MIAIIDYGVGNLFSLESSFLAIGEKVIVTADKQEIENADKILLPGVGAFEDAAHKLRACGLDAVIKQQVAKGKPLLGICLGMQLLFEKSYEYGEHQGLGLIKGTVKPIADVIPKDLKIPHIGWNELLFTKPSPIFSTLPQNPYVYFVHSFFAEGCEESLSAVTEYDIPITAAVEKDNIFGCQFHPEKSGNVGLSILRKFCQL